MVYFKLSKTLGLAKNLLGLSFINFHQRFALATVVTGFGRRKGNYRGQVTKGAPIGLLTLGMAILTDPESMIELPEPTFPVLREGLPLTDEGLPLTDDGLPLTEEGHHMTEEWLHLTDEGLHLTEERLPLTEDWHLPKIT